MKKISLIITLLFGITFFVLYLSSTQSSPPQSTLTFETTRNLTLTKQFEQLKSAQPENPFARHVSKQLNQHVSLLHDHEPIEPPAHYQRIAIHSAKEFQQALKQLQPNSAFIFADGHYSFERTIVINRPNIMLLSTSSRPEKVVFTGAGMKSTSKVQNLIDVHSSGFVIDGITLAEAPNHIIQIRAERQANFPIIRNCIIRDSYEQLIKVSYDKQKSPNHFSSGGLVENCAFFYSAGIGPNYYIGGIDAHGIHNWIIRNNLFKDIASPSGHIAEHAIHLWNNTAHNLVSGNIIIDSDRGIGFGMYKKNKHSNIRHSNFGGFIKDNVIFHSDNSDPFADVGISLEQSPNTIVENNLILQNHSYRNAIEYRFSETNHVEVTNNLVNRKITSRNNAQAKTKNNQTIDQNDFILAFSRVINSKKLPPHIQVLVSSN